MLVPKGEEMNYRYQESLVADMFMRSDNSAKSSTRSSAETLREEYRFQWGSNGSDRPILCLQLIEWCC